MVFVAVVPLLTVGSIAAATTSATAVTPGPVRDRSAATLRVPAGAVRTGALAGGKQLELRVTLAPRDPLAVTAELSSLYDRSSPGFHDWLAPGEFDQRYGPSGTEIAETVAWLHSRHVTDTRVDGFAIDAVVPAGVAAAAFGFTLQTYRSPSGHTGFAPSAAPLVPAALASTTVQSIIGLDSFDVAVAQGSGVGTATGSCTTANKLSDAGTFTYPQIAQNYGINTLAAGGLDGAGETVAVYELEGYDSGVAAYDTCFGLSPSISVRQLPGGGTTPLGGNDAEADLDIEAVATDAPKATIESYEGPNTENGAYATWAAIVDDDTAQVVSSSWDVCATSPETGTYHTLLEQAATQGQSVFVASGDWGAEGCLSSDSPTTEPAVMYPTSSPDVVSVGGTTLSSDGSEVAWNECEGMVASGCIFGASGGGVSTTETALPAQTAVTDSTSREVPDISANAGAGMVGDVAGTWGGYVGTSLATPMMASLVADRNQGCATTTGLFTPDLYTDASFLYGRGLDDVTTGDNDLSGTNDGLYAAGVGYDMATGLGTPLAAGLTCADVDAASSTSALAGTTITLAGFGLEGATVDFGAVAAAVVASTATSATVTVPAGTGTVKISATSALGAGRAAVSFTYPLPLGTPPAPRARAGNTDARVSVRDPAVADRTAPPTSYTVTAIDLPRAARGHQTCTVKGAAGSCTVTGLSNGDRYKFVSVARDAVYVSRISAASNVVVPAKQTKLRVTITGVDPTVAHRSEVETVTVRNIGAHPATGLTVGLTKVAGIAVRFAPGWAIRGQVLSRRLARLKAGKTVTYRVTLYLRAKPDGARYLAVAVTAANAARAQARHRFG